VVKRTWDEFYALMGYALTTEIRGDFARGQRDLNSWMQVSFGTFATGLRTIPAPQRPQQRWLYPNEVAAEEANA
jgi:hypothetical protein